MFDTAPNLSEPCEFILIKYRHARTVSLVCPQIFSTDLDGLWFWAAFGDEGRRNQASGGTSPEWGMTRAWSCRQEKASCQQIEPGSAKHLALQHLQAVDVPFNRPLTPGQRHPGLDGGVVRPESSGETTEGREGARGGARQPWLELSRLALADQAGEVLRERHRLCQRGRLLGQLRQLVVLLRCRPC
jgi:hypothetical protein